MTSLLTPEAICELDTFTLEQKIEELENLPQKALYLHTIRIAKIELIDRLDIEEFGRQLANDQYKLDPEFNLPPLPPPPLPSVKPSPNPKQFSSHLQLNPIQGRSFVTIGKPAVSHHYKPRARPKEVQSSHKPKAFLRAKKSSSVKASPKATVRAAKGETRSSVCELPKPSLRESSTGQKEVDQAELPSSCLEGPVKEEFSLKDKLKREVQQMQVVFPENDAYEDMKILQMSPLNLKEEEVRLLQEEEEEIPAREAEEDPLEKGDSEQLERGQDYSLRARSQEPQVEYLLEKGEKTQKADIICLDNSVSETLLGTVHPSWLSPYESVEVLEESRKEEPIVADLLTPTTHYQNQSATESLPPPKNKSSHKDALPSKEPHSSSLPKKTPKKDSSCKHAPIQLPLIHESLLKESKSKSVKVFTKKVQPPSRDEQDHCELVSSKLRQTIAQSGNSGWEWQAESNSSRQKGGGAGLSRYEQVLRSKGLPYTPDDLFPYNELIPSFQKLFPHSKNLLVTLRNVEQSLQMHVDKKVSSQSVSEEARRLSAEQDLTFRIYYESEKARKHSSLFGISLESFYRRSSIMLDRVKNQLEDPLPEEMLFYRVVRTKEEVYDIVNSSFHRTPNWYELPHGLELKNSWNLLWTWSRPQIDFGDLLLFQKVNHFLGNKQLARKDLLKKNIEKVQRLGSKMRIYFDIIPETFLLPGENIPFIKKFRANGLKDPMNYWILKPVGLSRGRGISLINKLEEVVFSEPIVLQKYISNPLLLDGFKFDIRIYVLVTSINPLEAFIYREGFARISTQPYSLREDLISNKFIHLTNFSIQRENLGEGRGSLEEELGGSKISLRMLALRLEAMGVQWAGVQRQIEDIVLKSLIACMNAIPPNPNSFELFGYDIFLDQEHKCWLLEVNSSPSLEKEFTLDQVIKQQLVDDIVEVVRPLNYDRLRLLEVVQRRRREAEGLKSSIRPGNNSHSQLNQDLDYLLRGQKLRRYGEAVDNNNFHMIAPSDSYHRIVRILQQYKIDPIVNKPE